jgi:nitroreductase
MVKLNLTADEVLTTTRSVRKRLDFDTPVPRELVLECLEIALQAPTGSNSQGWQWMFIDDPAKKLALRDLYKRHFDAYSKYSREWPDDDPRAAQKPAVRSSAEYLAENFHRVPVLMIPLIEGRLDGVPAFQSASAWGSLLPAVWSFMLALRERGLGSAWTTLHLPGEQEAAELLGIPYDRFTQGGLFPVAYTVGTEFKPAKRLPLDPIVHWNTW